jgi:hypothetical protein
VSEETAGCVGGWGGREEVIGGMLLSCDAVWI